MNGNASIDEGNGLDKDFAKGMGGDELIELLHLGVPEVAEATGLGYPEGARVVRCGAGADAEPAVRGHLLGVVETAVEAMEGVAGEIADNRLARVLDRGDHDVRVEIDYPLFYEPGRRAEGPAIPATVLDFAAYQMVCSAVQMDPLLFVDYSDPAIARCLALGEKPCFQFHEREFDDIGSDVREIWIEAMSKVARAW